MANVFDDPCVASRYEDWYSGPGRRADRLEKALLAKLLAGLAGSTHLLDVGCGTGHFTRWLAAQGLVATGVDVSPAMLAEARRLGCEKYVLGDALSLPFRDRAFDVTAMVTALEFLSEPGRALAEAVRVSRRGILLGVLNRWSIQALRRRHSGDPKWRTVRFFSPGELGRLVVQAAGPRLEHVAWRTTLWPLPWITDLPLPLGHFIGLSARLRDDCAEENG